MNTVRLARNAMACRFELVLQGEHEPWLRAAGEEALREIGRLEAQLSIFRSDSDATRINRMASIEPVRIDPRLFRLLDQCADLSAITDGAFDPTVAPMMEAWGFYRREGHVPDEETLVQLRERIGMHLVALDPERRTVRFERDDMRIDFGAIGKGFAVDEAIRVLREAGVERALLHGGTSTVYGLGRPLDAEAWIVGIPDPDDAERLIERVALLDSALSVSAVWGKSFEIGGRMFGHVLDPRIGCPVEGAALAAVWGPSATEADALSTAALVTGEAVKRPGVKSLVVPRGATGPEQEMPRGTVLEVTDGPHHRVIPLVS